MFDKWSGVNEVVTYVPAILKRDKPFASFHIRPLTDYTYTQCLCFAILSV